MLLSVLAPGNPPGSSLTSKQAIETDLFMRESFHLRPRNGQAQRRAAVHLQLERFSEDSRKNSPVPG